MDKKFLLIIIITAIISIMPLPPYIIHTIVMVYFYAYLGTSWSIIGGYCGQVSLGHAAFVGIGAYFTLFMVKWYDLTTVAGMIIGIFIATIASVVIGYPTFKFGVKGIYFSLTTIAFAEILREVFISFREITGGSLGVYIPVKENPFYYLIFDQKTPYLYIILGLYIISIIIVSKIKRFLFVVRAISLDEDVAASLGINVSRTKLIALAISAALTSIGGWFYIIYYRYMTPDSVFGLFLSVEIALIAILGGSTTIYGPLLGSAILIPMSELLRIIFGGIYAGLHLAIYSIVLATVVIFIPQGIIPYINARRRSS